ncbi:MAG TPA: hypothetical protein VFH66_07870 [Mycobacteriales bacterium]|nr:hypothetical protein [Mycobacteriales bacterium]
MKFHARPALLLVLAAVSGVTACSGSRHFSAKAAAIHCPLQVSGHSAGRAVVTYDDATGNPKMSAAITQEVAAWNASTAPVMLKPAKSNAALTFRAVTTKATVERCTSTAPRTVTVELETTKWNALVNGSKSAVKDPAGAIAHVIGRALGLRSQGKCPSLTSPNSCTNRAQTPDPTQMQELQKLYGASGSTGGSASPTASS